MKTKKAYSFRNKFSCLVHDGFLLQNAFVLDKNILLPSR